MPEIIHVQGPGELLSLVPRLLGFAPRDSLVILGIDGRGRVVMTARLDREDCRLEEVAVALADATAGEARRTGTVGVVVIEYSDALVPWGTEASELLVRNWGGWLEVRDIWVVHGGRYWSPGCIDVACCPPGGRPLPRTGSGEGTPTSTTRTPVAPAFPFSDPGDRRRARRARARFVARRAHGEHAWRVEALAGWEKAIAQGEATVPELGRLGAALAVPEVRDALILAAIAAPKEEVLAVLRGLPTSSLTALDAVMHGGACPDDSAMETFSGLLLAVATVSRAPERAGALAVLALMRWWQGDAPQCVAAADEALRCMPANRLAALSRETAMRGILPGWLRFSGDVSDS